MPSDLDFDLLAQEFEALARTFEGCKFEPQRRRELLKDMRTVIGKIDKLILILSTGHQTARPSQPPLPKVKAQAAR
jgi:hypothetical protein